MMGLLLCTGVSLGQGKGKGKAPRPKPVVVAPVRSVTDPPTFKASGLLSPMSKALLSVEVAGRVTAIKRREGDYVKKGHVLAVLNNTDLELNRMVLRARVKEAEAELLQSRQSLRRTSELHRQNLASLEKYENVTASAQVMEARHASAVAQLKRVQTQVDLLTLRAPISGQIIKTDLEIGQWINSNKPIFEIYNFSRFELLVGLPGKFLNKVSKGSMVKVNVGEIGEVLQGKILAVVRHVDAFSGNFKLRIGADNPRGLPLSGLLARIAVPVGGGEAVLTVPRDAIVRRGGKTTVVVVRGGKAQIVPVSVKGNINQSDVIVDGTLKAKEEVVVRGNERLFPGTPVMITGKL
jgi:RND family efflux transporter MFP subunit